MNGHADTGSAYTPPPTPGDRDMSLAHHVDSIEYNLKHARAHLDEVTHHTARLRQRVSKKPGVRDQLRKVSR